MDLVECICRFCNSKFLHHFYESSICQKCHERFRKESRKYL